MRRLSLILQSRLLIHAYNRLVVFVQQYRKTAITLRATIRPALGLAFFDCVEANIRHYVRNTVRTGRGVM